MYDDELRVEGRRFGVGKTQVLFIGEEGADRRLKTVVKSNINAEKAEFGNARVESVYAAAMGVADLVKGEMDYMKPSGCWEPLSCKELRQSVKAEWVQPGW